MTNDMISAAVALVAFEASYWLDRASFEVDSKDIVDASYGQFLHNTGTLVDPYQGNDLLLEKILPVNLIGLASPWNDPCAFVAAFALDDSYAFVVAFALGDSYAYMVASALLTPSSFVAGMKDKRALVAALALVVALASALAE